MPKENEPKEKAPVPLGPAGCLALLKAARILQTRFAQTCKIPFRSFSGAQQVAMGNTNSLTIRKRYKTRKQKNMWKKLLNGLFFGTGVGIAFVAVCLVAIYFILPRVVESSFESESISHSEKEVNTVPAVEELKLFLGSPAIYSSGFQDKNTVLSEGPGVIIGNATVNGVPVEGLKLRLALNKIIKSQWAVTDSDGNYKVRVPYGKYVINGFELDRVSANKVLPNKINHPQRAHSSSSFVVSEESVGRGLDFKFVDPIIRNVKKVKYSSSEEVILEWEPYSNAAEYSVQVYEKDDPYSWSNNTLFDWSEKPKVSENRISLKDFNAQLTPGKFYVFDVYAMDKQNRMLSETEQKHSGYDFEVTE